MRNGWIDGIAGVVSCGAGKELSTLRPREGSQRLVSLRTGGSGTDHFARLRGKIGICAFLACVSALGIAPARAYEQKPGTISLGVQLGGGVASGQGEYKPGTLGTPIAYADYFGGPAIGIRLRYALDRGHAFGISFDDLRFDRKSELSAPVPSQYQVNNYMADYYVYLNRAREISGYIVLGAGVHRDTFRPDTIVPSSFVANFGLGLEYFVGAPFAVDLATRGYYLQGKGGSAVTGVLSLGFQYYLLN